MNPKERIEEYLTALKSIETTFRMNDIELYLTVEQEAHIQADIRLLEMVLSWFDE